MKAMRSVDAELVQAPQRWDIKFIRKFMLVFGTLSSVFDCLTFAVLIWLGATMEQFRTGWFIESVVSASLIVLVVRSRRPFFNSRPSKLLVITTGAVVVAAFLMPHFQFAPLLGFTPMPAKFYAIVTAIVLFYIVAAELTKRAFYRAAAKGRRSS
jgi:Mg2+-importing ATPase